LKNIDPSKQLNDSLSRHARRDYCYLTTTGRVSGKPHEIEIWFGLRSTTIYLLSGGGDQSDWVKNLRANPSVTVRIAKDRLEGQARIVSDEPEELEARQLLASKYQGWRKGRRMSEWARTALPVAIDIISYL